MFKIDRRMYITGIFLFLFTACYVPPQEKTNSSYLEEEIVRLKQRDTDLQQQIDYLRTAINSLRNITPIPDTQAEAPSQNNEVKETKEPEIKSKPSDKEKTKPKSVQCAGITKKGKRCSRMTTDPSGYCYQHKK